jgi:hypothetical protein
VKITKTAAELDALDKIGQTAAAFSTFEAALRQVTGWEFDSVYNLLITYNELSTLHDSGELRDNPRDVLVVMARAGTTVGPYDAKGHVSQAISDDLVAELFLIRDGSDSGTGAAP